MGSVRRRGGVVRVGLDDAEVVLLASLAGQVRDMLVGELADDLADGTEDPLQALTGMRSTEVRVPDDPVMQRLLPDAYREDPEAAGEYRRLMDADLRLQKAAALRRILDDLSAGGSRKGSEQRLELTDESAEQWLYGLTDVRLVLGTMLDITEEMDDERASLEPGSPRFMQLGIYDWVTWLQDAIVRAVSD
ncbi:MAG: DUF2017 domain-containing protein [Mycobacteriales bacterium]